MDGAAGSYEAVESDDGGGGGGGAVEVCSALESDDGGVDESYSALESDDEADGNEVAAAVAADGVASTRASPSLASAGEEMESRACLAEDGSKTGAEAFSDESAAAESMKGHAPVEDEGLTDRHHPESAHQSRMGEAYG